MIEMNWFDIGTIDDIPRRGARCVKTPQGKILRRELRKIIQ